MNTDLLLPAFIFVLVRAQVQHLGAEIRLIADFCAEQLASGGQVELMFTLLYSAYIQVGREKSSP